MRAPCIFICGWYKYCSIYSLLQAGILTFNNRHATAMIAGFDSSIYSY